MAKENRKSRTARKQARARIESRKTLVHKEALAGAKAFGWSIPLVVFGSMIGLSSATALMLDGAIHVLAWVIVVAACFAAIVSPVSALRLFARMVLMVAPLSRKRVV